MESSATQSIATGVDVLIVTALKLEFDAVVECGIGFPGTSRGWIDRHDGPYHYRVREFLPEGIQPLRIAVARSTEVGEVSASVCAVRLLEALQAPTLAMCGVCAGREGAVELGDVIATERLYKYDMGATVSSARAEEYQLSLLSDIRTYSLHLDWRQKLDEFDEQWQKKIPAPCRPIPVAEQARWIAAQLADGPTLSVRDVFAFPERETRCSDWEAALHRLDRLGWLTPDWTGLSDEGVKHGRRELSLYPAGRPIGREPRLRVGAIATGARVQRDVRLFERLDAISRRTLGVEMEGAALAAVAEIYERRMFLAKGVMDFADPDKDDTFKVYAAQAAAAFLLTFLVSHAPRAQIRATGKASTATVAGRSVPDNESQIVAAAVEGQASAQGRWFIQLRAPILKSDLADALAPYAAGEPFVLEAEEWDTIGALGQAATYSVRSSTEMLSRTLRAFRKQSFREAAGAPLEYIVEQRDADSDDPCKGRYGWLPRRLGRSLMASVTSVGGDWFEVTLKVTSLTASQPLPPAIELHVHPTLSEKPIRVPTKNDEAKYSFVAWDAFTVGAVVLDNEGTQLELDLAGLPGVPAVFCDR